MPHKQPAAVLEQQRRRSLELHKSHRRADSQRMNPAYWRLTYALLLSLLIHTLLLSLTFSGQGGWFPGFGFPWQDRKIEAPDLRVVVVPAPVTARGAGGPAGRGAVAAGIGRAACCRWAGADATRVPCADPAADCGSDRAGGQALGRGQSKDRRRDRCGSCANDLARRSGQ